jgi:hypothetical protein
MAMSVLGQQQKSGNVALMSALPPKVDIAECDPNVRFVPETGTALAWEPARQSGESFCRSRNQISGIDSSARRAPK